MGTIFPRIIFPRTLTAVCRRRLCSLTITVLMWMWDSPHGPRYKGSISKPLAASSVTRNLIPPCLSAHAHSFPSSPCFVAAQWHCIHWALAGAVPSLCLAVTIASSSGPVTYSLFFLPGEPWGDLWMSLDWLTERCVFIYSVISGVGELDLDGERCVKLTAVCGPQSWESPYPDCPYLLLDVRDRDEYDQCHVISGELQVIRSGGGHGPNLRCHSHMCLSHSAAYSYPVATLSRTMNPYTKEVLDYVSTHVHDHSASAAVCVLLSVFSV